MMICNPMQRTAVSAVSLAALALVLGLSAASGALAQAPSVMPDPPIGPYKPFLFGRALDTAAPAERMGTLPPLGYSPGVAPPKVISSPKMADDGEQPAPAGATPPPASAETAPAQVPPPVASGQFPPLGAPLADR